MLVMVAAELLRRQIRRITFQSQSWANSSQDPISKNPSQKRAGGVAQVVESLPSK
jgi:hypothetical protein